MIKYIIFYPNVYIVSGSVNDAIYDFQSGKIIPISRDVTSSLYKMAYEGIDFDSFEEGKILEIFQSIIKEVSSISKGFNDYSKLLMNYKINFAWIELIKTCNLECVHCYEESSPKIKSQISTENFIYILDVLENYGCNNIQFIGGEPLLLKEQLIEYSKMCISRGFKLEIFTNGTLINDEFAKFCFENRISVAVSLYSSDKDQHNLVTKSKTSYDKTLNGLSFLKKNNVKFRVAHTATIASKKLDDGDYRKFNAKTYPPRIIGRFTLDQIDEQLFLSKSITLEKILKTHITVDSFSKNLSGHNCYQSKLYIDTDLNIYPCVMERRFSYFNLKKQINLKGIEEESKKFKKDSIDECKNCEFRYGCFDCRPDSIVNNLYAKPWYCTYRPKEGIWINPKLVFNKLQESKFNELSF